MCFSAFLFLSLSFLYSHSLHPYHPIHTHYIYISTFFFCFFLSPMQCVSWLFTKKSMILPCCHKIILHKIWRVGMYMYSAPFFVNFVNTSHEEHPRGTCTNDRVTTAVLFLPGVRYRAFYYSAMGLHEPATSESRLNSFWILWLPFLMTWSKFNFWQLITRIPSDSSARPHCLIATFSLGFNSIFNLQSIVNVQQEYSLLRSIY